MTTKSKEIEEESEEEEIKRQVLEQKKEKARKSRRNRKKFISIVNEITAGKDRDRAVDLFDKFDSKLELIMIDIFRRIKYPKPNDEDPIERSRKEINELLFKVLWEMEKYKKRNKKTLEQPSSEPKLVHKDSEGFAMGSQEEFLRNVIYIGIFNELPPVPL